MNHEPGCGQTSEIVPADMCSTCRVLRNAYQRGVRDSIAHLLERSEAATHEELIPQELRGDYMLGIIRHETVRYLKYAADVLKIKFGE